MRFRKAISVVDGDDLEVKDDMERNVVRAAAYSNAATTLREKFRDSENFDHATEAATNFNEAITSLEDAVGHDHIRISKVLCDFSLLLEMIEDHEGVEAALRRALTIHSNWGLQPNSNQNPGQAAAERTEMIVPLAAACKAQNNMNDVLELEDPFFKCVEVAIGTNPKYTETALDHVRTFMGILDKDQSEVDFALKLFQGLKSGSNELNKSK